MEFNNVRMVDPLNVEQLDVLPEFIPNRDQSRFVWLSDGTLWYGDVDKWVKISIKDYGYHNDLTGREEIDCHPIQSITDLPNEINRIDNSITYLYGNQFKWFETDIDCRLFKFSGYFADTTDNTINLTLPSVSASEIGDVIKIIDHKRTFNKNHITILTNGSKIEGSTDNKVISMDDSTTVLTYSDESYGWDCITYRNTLNFETEIINDDTDIIPNTSYLVDTRIRSILLTVPDEPQDTDTIKIRDIYDTNTKNPITIKKKNGDIVTVIDSGCNNGILVFSSYDDVWVYNTECKELNDDITIYVAPDRADKSPDDVAVGSDETGNGTISKPFFSVKKAIEYIERNFYVVPSGVSINIIGLPGIYDYSFKHRVRVKSDIMKNVNINFPAKYSNYYHQTSVKVDSVNIDHYSSYDVVSFNVEDVGSGFYEIKRDDYIKISIDTDLSVTPEGAVWAGYFRVYSVDKQNKRISIYFERTVKLPGHYILPGETHINAQIILTKLTTHININGTSNYDDYIFHFLNGINKIHINMGCTIKNEHRAIHIMYHTVTDIIMNISRFFVGVMSEHCSFYFSSGNDYDKTSAFTACTQGLLCYFGAISVNRCLFNNCVWGFIVYYIQRMEFISSGFVIINCVAGFSGRHSKIVLFPHPEVNVMNIYYCNSGMDIFYRSMIDGYGINISHCVRGIFVIDHSSLRTIFPLDMSSTPAKFGKIHDCTYGIDTTNQGSVEIGYIEIYNCTIGIKIRDGSHGRSSDIHNTPISSFIHDNDIGIQVLRTGTLMLITADVRDNDIGIYCVESSSFDIRSSTITNSKNKGIYCAESSYGRIYRSNVTNSTNQDLYTLLNSNVLIEYSTIDTPTPLPDEPPVYTGWTAGSYNVEVNSKKSNGDIWGDNEGCA
jgi:hypothetical protein